MNKRTKLMIILLELAAINMWIGLYFILSNMYLYFAFSALGVFIFIMVFSLPKIYSIRRIRVGEARG